MPEYRSVPDDVVERVNLRDWDAYADDYQAEHGEFLRDVGLVWCPEGLEESVTPLLGDVRGQRVLEVGCGAGQGARWLRSRGATVVGFDLSGRQLQHSRRIDDATGIEVPVVQATVTAIPLGDAEFDLAFSAFGALPFVVDIRTSLGEVARVLRPGGRFVFSVVHPSRWMFADDPTRRGMTVTRSYFDRRPYVETDGTGAPTYVEPHHTMADWVDALVAAGLSLDRLVEPSWPVGHDRIWGGWGPERGAYLPGTAIFVTHLDPPG